MQNEQNDTKLYKVDQNLVDSGESVIPVVKFTEIAKEQEKSVDIAIDIYGKCIKKLTLLEQNQALCLDRIERKFRSHILDQDIHMEELKAEVMHHILEQSAVAAELRLEVLNEVTNQNVLVAGLKKEIKSNNLLIKREIVSRLVIASLVASFFGSWTVLFLSNLWNVQVSQDSHALQRIIDRVNDNYIKLEEIQSNLKIRK